MADLDRIGQMADRIASAHGARKKIVAVVSAMAGETDRLLELAHLVCENPPRREVDALLSTGELSSAALLAIALSKRGVESISMSGPQIPIRTDFHFGRAQIANIPPQHLERHLSEGRVVVVAGFQGVTELGDITTLGRGGSDLTAVALAAALNAERCELYKDVEGIFTADPRLCADARRINEISYDEMLELAHLGAKVLQPRSVLLAKRYAIPVHVLPAFKEGPGTWVKKEEGPMEGRVVAAVTCDRKESKISVRRLPDPVRSASSLFSALAKEGIVVDVIVQDRSADGKTNLTFTVPRDEFSTALQIAEAISKKTSKDSQVLSTERIAKVSAVGLGMKTRSGVAAEVFEALAKEEIEIMAVSTSDIKVSCVIDDRYAELAVRVLHEAFGLAKEPN